MLSWHMMTLTHSYVSQQDNSVITVVSFQLQFQLKLLLFLFFSFSYCYSYLFQLVARLLRFSVSVPVIT